MAADREWRRWDRFDWNSLLVRHYFSRETGEEPVTHLEVSWQVLWRLTGDESASVTDVQTHFLERFQRYLGKNKFITAAESAGTHEGIPCYFVHLFVTCLVSSEAQEDQERPGEMERDFREGLGSLLGDKRHETGLDRLPILWEKFAVWTKESDSYRPLLLPETGRETLIGYSKRLVFPRLQDQRKLVRLLADTGLLFEDPPVSLLVERLGKTRTHMSPDLLNAFDELRDSFANDPFNLLVSNLRFLEAVNLVVRNSALLLEEATEPSETTLLLADYADSIELSVSASSEFPFKGAVAERDPFQPAEWPFRITSVGSNDSPVEALLVDGLASPLKWLTQPGVIPFVTTEGNSTELLKRGSVSEATYLLVRVDRLDAVATAFGLESTSFLESGIPGWFINRNPGLRQLTVTELQTFGLTDAMALHQRPARNVLRLRDGYEVFGEFLGFRSILPWIQAPNALDVTATIDDSDLDLRSVSGQWRLPDRDLFGPVVVSATFPAGKTLTRRTTFVAEPMGTTYKPPSEPHSWMVETTGGSTIYPDAQTAALDGDISNIADAAHRIFLGPVVGEFLSDHEGAVWELSSFGSIRSIRTLEPPERVTPTGRVEDKGLCRAWRQTLDRFSAAAADDPTKHAIHRSKAATDLTLGVVETTRNHFVRSETYAKPHENCRLVQAALGSYCARRAGIDISGWNRLLESAFRITPLERRFVHRAWLEAGFIDEARRIQWSGVSIFARTPFLWLFRSGDDCFGSVEGLVMPSRMSGLEDLAGHTALVYSLNNSPSPHVPPRLMVRGTEHAIRDFASRAELEIRYLPPSPIAHVHRREDAQHIPPLGYRPERSMPTFMPPECVELLMHSRSGAPRYWSARTEGHQVWSYAPEAPSFWICRKLGLETTRLGKGAELEAHRSFLPLSIARWLSGASSISPGPINGQYLNVASSRQLAERTIEFVNVLPQPQSIIGGSHD